VNSVITLYDAFSLPFLHYQEIPSGP